MIVWLALIALALAGPPSTADRFECGRYRVVGALVDDVKGNDLLKMYAGTERAYSIVLNGVPPERSLAVQGELVELEVEVREVASGSGVRARWLSYLGIATPTRALREAVKKIAPLPCAR